MFLVSVLQQFKPGFVLICSCVVYTCGMGSGPLTRTWTTTCTMLGFLSYSGSKSKSLSHAEKRRIWPLIAVTEALRRRSLVLLKKVFIRWGNTSLSASCEPVTGSTYCQCQVWRYHGEGSTGRQIRWNTTNGHKDRKSQDCFYTLNVCVGQTQASWKILICENCSSFQSQSEKSYIENTL